MTRPPCRNSVVSKLTPSSFYHPETAGYKEQPSVLGQHSKEVCRQMWQRQLRLFLALRDRVFFSQAALLELFPAATGTRVISPNSNFPNDCVWRQKRLVVLLALKL